MTDTERIALVTGANKGIGFEIARQLAQSGATVLLGARDPDRGREAAIHLAAAGLSAEVVRLDLNDPASLAEAAGWIDARFGRLDILVNNAAIADAADGPPSTASTDAVRRILLTNFLGTLETTQALLPLLRRSAAGRIVNLSSPLGSMTIAGDPDSPFNAQRLLGYGASKACVNLLTRHLAAELEGSGVTVNAVVPGYVKTDLTGGEGFMTPEEGARLPVEYALMTDPVTDRFVSPLGSVDW